MIEPGTGWEHETSFPLPDEGPDMLEVTPMAAEVINELTSQSAATDDGVGLRFALAADHNSQAALELSLSEAVDGDQVVTADAGAKVIMEPAAAQYLDDKVLDVRQDAEGNPAFAIARQDPTT
ncbi:iron-sulfur cluster biosynthesis protein [Lentzea flava]|uniref:Iron-sulfur cluster biosynthesis protein n=2 Tax=Lentzea flava TaxID=103732 RepID=A0ABQ2UY18_9PSEU|nr:iron-sulfur cluster biosynthesis protein [Lentzea flava]